MAYIPKSMAKNTTESIVAKLTPRLSPIIPPQINTSTTTDAMILVLLECSESVSLGTTRMSNVTNEVSVAVPMKYAALSLFTNPR